METRIHGSATPGYEPVGDVFRSFFDKQWDTGSAVSVYRSGNAVVRLTGGMRVGAEETPYDEHTIQLVASTTKFVESLTIALLVDRGLLSYDDRIVDHWPTFATGDDRGKSAVTVRQLMMHRAGLPVFDRKLGDEELFDLDARARFLERQTQVPSLFAPESATDWCTQSPAPPQAYHAVSRGLYSSELVRRVDPAGRSLGVFFRDEIAAPLGIDFWIGLPDEESARVSGTRPDPMVIMKLMAGDVASLRDSGDPRYQLHDHELAFLRQLLTEPDSIASRALNCLAPAGVAPQEIANHPKVRACELASSNGVGSADALARLAALAVGGGTLGATRIFRSGEALRQAADTANEYATDGLMGVPVVFTQGGFARFVSDDGLRTESIGWGGAGGQLVRFVPELDLAIAYVTNTLGSRMAMYDPRGLALLDAAVACARSDGRGS